MLKRRCTHNFTSLFRIRWNIYIRKYCLYLLEKYEKESKKSPHKNIVCTSLIFVDIQFYLFSLSTSSSHSHKEQILRYVKTNYFLLLHASDYDNQVQKLHWRYLLAHRTTDINNFFLQNIIHIQCFPVQLEMGRFLWFLLTYSQWPSMNFFPYHKPVSNKRCFQLLPFHKRLHHRHILWY